MARLSPEEGFTILKDRIEKTVTGLFPIVGKRHTLSVSDVKVNDNLNLHDLRSQKAAKLGGRSWAVPVEAKVSLIDNETKKKIDEQKIRLMNLPKTTPRFGQIVDGQEYQIDNQWRLKSGIYARIKDNGELESQFNLAKGRGFHLGFDPKSRKFNMEYGSSNIPLYPILREMGVPHEEIHQHWGKDITAANQKEGKGEEQALIKFYKAATGKKSASLKEAKDHLFNTFNSTQLRPDTTQLTLGKPFDKVTGPALFSAATKLLHISQGKKEPDPRDALMFKELHSAEDFFAERLQKGTFDITRRIQNTLDRKRSVRSIVGPDIFNKPIRMMYRTTLANIPEQTNPLEMFSGQVKTTITGEGGIKSAHTITEDAKLVDPSHLGFLDPLHTPEGCHFFGTEVYTKDGWKYWQDVTENDFLACRIDGVLSFHKPLRLICADYEGPMYGVDTSRGRKRSKRPINYLVTPDHKIFCRPCDTRCKTTWRLERADTVHGKSRDLQLAHGPYQGELSQLEYFSLPYVEGNNSSINVDHIPMTDWAQFMGWYLAEGSCTYDEETSSYYTCLHQSVVANPHKCQIIEALLTRLPFTWSYQEREDGKRTYTISTKQLAHYMSQFGKQPERFIPDYFFEASIEVREYLLESLLLGDGRRDSHRSNGASYRQDVYCTTSLRLALDVEKLAIGLGRPVSFSQYEDKRKDTYLDVFEVRLLRHKEREVVGSKGHFYKVDYRGKVYCAEVPGHLLYVRLNKGLAHWSGNSTTGVTLRLPLGVKKQGHDVAIQMYDLKAKKLIHVTPSMAMDEHVVLPDQVKWKGNTPVPIASTVKISGPGNEIMEAPFSKARYVMKDPLQMFSMATNLVPFVAADHANRSTMAGRQMEQAIPLLHREVPLVQSRAKAQTFDQIMGRFAGHASPTTGVVERVKQDGIIIKDRRGKKHEVQLYDHFPLNSDKSFLHSKPLVKAGDKVEQGQVVADTNFTRGGSLAMGINLRLGYLPYKGLNFEDGIVVSESAAKKLTSEHLHRKALEIDKSHILDKKKFQAYNPVRLTKDQAEKLDEGGVIKPGSLVMPGDTLIAALQHKTEDTESRQLARIHKSLVRPYRDASVVWEQDHPGVVEEVVKRGRQTSVHVKTLEPAEIGDKLTARHGNKGIIVKIIPDHEMPHTADSKPIDVAFNPVGIPGRTNLGQVLEIGAAKIAEKTGKPYLIKNFEPGTDLHAQVSKDLKEHKLTDKEMLYDPQTKRQMGEALVGPQYIFKLKHQVEKKMVSRAGGAGYAYDRNMVPKGGGPHGAQSLGTLGFYAMLAHGAKANLREMQTLKSDASQNDEFWAAIQAGEPLPAPRPTFAYKKFLSYLNVMGLNTKKEGNSLQLVPFTDKHILAMSNGELKDAGRMVRAKDLKPEPHGLFDPKITGGLDGNKWSHIKLPEAFPNPVFESAIQSLTGMTVKDYEDVMAGRTAVDPKTGKLVDGRSGLSGGPAFAHLLKNVDVKKELKSAEDLLNKPGLKGNRLDQVHKKVKYLRALNSVGMDPHEAYMMEHVPVLPPSMRPLSQLPNGDLNTDDLNHMYKGIALSAQQMKGLSPLLPHSEKAPARYEIYDGLRSLAGLGGHMNQTFRGVLDIIGGKRPDPFSIGSDKSGQAKTGFFQGKLVQRKQDLSMRSTIIPEPSLGLDEVGLPRPAAMELYKPFVVAEIRKLTGVSPLEAQKLIKDGGELVHKALERVVDQRPVLLKRDPVLHKYNVQAFKPRIISGKAVQIHPLVTSGFNADFDGDTMAAFVPASPAAVEEAKKMYPSRNLFSPASGDLMYSPTLDTRLGLYGITQMGEATGKKFGTFEEVKKAVDKGEIELTDKIAVSGLTTTPGRLMVAHSLPEDMRKSFLSGEGVLHKKGQSQLLSDIAKNHPNDYGNVVNKLKDLGNHWSTSTAFSIGLEDIKPEKGIRDAILSKADKKVQQIKAGPGSREEKDRKAIAVYEAATQEMTKAIDKMPESHSRLLKMNRSGIKPEMDTLRQIKMAPMLISNAKGETIPTPVKRSYSEGLDIADYWTSVSGARKGIIQKVQSVQQPGYITKQIMNSTMNNLIVDHDCGTDKGIALDIDEKDVLDRHLAVAVRAGKTSFEAGTLITPEVRNTLRNAKVGKVVIRSPLRCNHGPGVCQKCFGLSEEGKHHELGTNVGVIAGQSLGERGTQLAMKAFHCNHADSLVFVKNASASQVYAYTLEDLFDVVDSPITISGDEEIKRVSDDLLTWDGQWVALTHVRRHRQIRPMNLVSDGHLVTICQDNHPIGVWKNMVRCSRCGYHRFKDPHNRSRQYCARCKRPQEAPEHKIGELSFLPPSAIDSAQYYLRHDLSPIFEDFRCDDLPIDPYVVGMFLAEGCVVWKRSHKAGRKRPYQINISQNEGPIRDTLLFRMQGISSVKSDNPRYVLIDNVEMGQQFHELFGRYSRDISLPPDFLGYSPKYLCTVLAGLIDGDGTEVIFDDGPSSINIDTTSFALAQQAVLICAKVGIVAGIGATKVRSLTRNQGFRVRLRMTNESVKLLSDSVKVRRLDAHRSPEQEVSLTGHRLVKTIRDVIYTHEYVYDATTESGTLFVSGLYHHNTGGTASSKSAIVEDFKRIEQLLRFPKILPGSATLSTVSGKVEKVVKDPAGGHNVYIGGERHYIPQAVGDPLVRAGHQVKKGDPLSPGPINPHELLPLTNIEQVQGYLANELHSIYGPLGIRRKNSEMVVKALTNLTRVEDPGDHGSFIRGDFAPTSQVAQLNRTVLKGKKPIIHTPVLKGVNVLPNEMQEDWIARLNHERLNQTIVDAAQQGWVSSLHGEHPIPAVVHGAEIGRNKEKPWAY